MNIDFQDAPAQWFKAFALAGIDLSDGGQFEMIGNSSSSADEHEAAIGETPLAQEEMLKAFENNLALGSHCGLCYRGFCLYCYVP